MNKHDVRFTFINETVIASFDSVEEGERFCMLYQHEKYKPKGLNTFNLLIKMLNDRNIKYIIEKNF